MDELSVKLLADPKETNRRGLTDGDDDDEANGQEGGEGEGDDDDDDFDDIGVMRGHETNFPEIDIMEEEKLRRKLKFFFMNPVEKWHAKRRFPYKLVLLLCKIILVTIQLCFFAHHRTNFIDYVFHNRIAFSHLFLQGWDSSREITTYPPQSGTLAIYKTCDFFSAIDYAVVNYANLHEAIGPYSYPNGSDLLQFCFTHYRECLKPPPGGLQHTGNGQTTTYCLSAGAVAIADSANFSSEDFFRNKNVTIEFSCLVAATVSFGIQTINFQSIPSHCLKFNASLIFDNMAIDGQMKLTLDVVVDEVEGRSGSPNQGMPKSAVESVLLTILNMSVITTCFLSGILCLRAVYRAQVLKEKTVAILRKCCNRHIGWEVKWEFLNLWYVSIMASDILILIGSVMKEKIEENTFSGDDLNLCSLVLGTGNFLVWFSLLRYLGFFKTYNAIILTLKVAAPALFRFMVCVLLIYAGFTFCGWLVLGPYHIKFRTLSGTSECLFALINGDDVFGTFSTLEPTKSSLIWWFSRIYLYIFISFFIYVVLSLFVSVIVDAYEVIKSQGSAVCPQSDIKEFMDGCGDRDGCSIASSSMGDFSFRNGPIEFARAICCCVRRGSNRTNRCKVNS